MPDDMVGALGAMDLLTLHLGTALLALIVGPFALLRRRRDRLHRIAGYLWVSAMCLAALSSFGLSGLAVLGPFGPIHILSVVVLVQLWRGVAEARAGRIEAHRRRFLGLYFQGLGVAGAFTLLPGRTVSRAITGDQDLLAWIGIAVVLALLWLGFRATRRHLGLPAAGAINF